MRRVWRAARALIQGVRNVNRRFRWVWEFGALVLLVVLFIIIAVGVNR